MKLIIGTRGSKLALIQTEYIKNLIKSKYENIDIEIKIIKTKGDILLNKKIKDIGGKGIFVEEIEKNLLEKNIDIAVHSMKDIPSQKNSNLEFAPPPVAEDPRDVLVSNKKISSLNDIRGLKIGSGSLRRVTQIKKLIDVNTVDIRGNIDTRISKVDNNEVDGVILAYSGLKRANLTEKISYIFDPLEIIPAPCQGILAIEYRKDDLKIKKILENISDKKTTFRANLERKFQCEIDSDCKKPVGIYINLENNLEEKIKVTAFYGKEDGSFTIRKTIETDKKNAFKDIEKLAKYLKEKVNEKGNC
ncbi:MAG: hydroxymethylbilane synthase [Peptoniphilaceae bacterium]|nr:hydroxymethylbilane synthase [Peptoniphilaceae bacterium]MDY3738555.1 hydroxymethylbilane synthase [Peptoniphilaceae bacterium]